MCRLSSSQYDLYKRTNSELGRLLFGWLRDLWRPRQPQAKEAAVIMLPPEAGTRGRQEADRERSKAA